MAAVNDIINTAQILLADYPDGAGANDGDRWSFAELLSYLNSACRDIVLQTINNGMQPAYSKTLPVKLTKGAKQDLSSLVSDSIKIYDVTRNLGRLWVDTTKYIIDDAVYSPLDSNRYISLTTHTAAGTDPSADSTNWVASELIYQDFPIEKYQKDVLDLYLPSWISADPDDTAVVQYWIQSDNQRQLFYVYPQQPNNTGLQYVEITYAASPAPVVAGGSLVLGDIYQEAIVAYIMYKAFSKDDEVSDTEGLPRSAMHYQEYTNNPALFL